MRTWKAVVLLAAVMAACDDPVGLVLHDDAGSSSADTGPAPSEDVGVPDTGPGLDAGERPDAGTSAADSGPLDAAESVDAAALLDGSFEPDVGAKLDAGAAWDGGGQPDSGLRPDAAAGLDASESPDSGGANGAIGQPCAQASDCASDTCLGTADGWPSAGYCAQSGCNVFDPVNTCPAGSRCRNIAPNGQPTRAMCLDLCQTDGTDPCADGLSCARHGGGSPYYVCEPP
ncbi:MAG: hypothetical protein QM765_45140 [Myxococcales bacterium]